MAAKDIPIEEKTRIVEAYLSGEISSSQARKQAGVSDSTIRRWARQYKAKGSEGLVPARDERYYSKELKLAAVQDYLQGGQSLDTISERYDIRSNSRLSSWVRMYKKYGEIRIRKRGAAGASGIAAGAVSGIKRRKVGYEERVAISKECVAAGNDYAGMALKHQVAYAQVFDWVKKYQAGGEEALKDHRGHNRFTPGLENNSIPATIVITRLIKKYKVERAWLWRILEDEYNIQKGSGYVMNPIEIKDFKSRVAAAVENGSARQTEQD